MASKTYRGAVASPSVARFLFTPSGNEGTVRAPSHLTWALALVAAGVIAAAAGCSNSVASGDPNPHASNASPGAADAPDGKSKDGSTASAPAEPQGPQEQESQQAGTEGDAQRAAENGFVPPFPEKLKDVVHLFSPPIQRVVVAPSRQEASREDEPVRLVGFVNVGQCKALLAIGDQLHLAAAGERVEGVEIVAIDGWLVTLQRGTHRWSTALLDQPLVHRPATTTQYVHRPPSRSTPARIDSASAGPTTSSIPQPSAPTLPLPGFPDPPDAEDVSATLELPELPDERGKPAL